MTSNFEIAEVIGGWKANVKLERGSKQGTAHAELLHLPNMAQILQVVDYVPPPPPPGYKGICRAPLDSPPR